jgi:murein DD-endopeptidase MepM/ murein hydrolase activator NlpD
VPQKVHGSVSILFLILILPLAMLWISASPSAAEGNWDTMTWDSDVQKLEQLSASRGITSRDVLWANDYADLPPSGETLLVPNSKTELLLTWMEVQNKRNGPEPLVTIKLHGVPAKLRDAPPPAQTIKAPAKPPVSNSSVKNMTVVVSRDELIIVTPTGDVIQEKPSLEKLQSEKLPSEKPATVDSVIFPSVPKLTAEALASLPPLTLPPPKRATPPASGVPTPSSKMMWPVNGKVSSGFGRRGKRHFHAGIDIPMPQGTAIAAAQDGVVLEVSTTKSKKYRGYGNAALIDHGNGIATMYAHCQSISVKAGQRVKKGDIVGLVGNTGRTTTHHIHFEVRKNGKPVDPIPYLTPR